MSTTKCFNSTPITPDSPSPGNTSQSPISTPPSANTNSKNTSFPITTTLIPPSMISMNKTNIPLTKNKNTNIQPKPKTRRTLRKRNRPNVSNCNDNHRSVSRSRSRSRSHSHSHSHSRSRSRSHSRSRSGNDNDDNDNDNSKKSMNICMDLTGTNTPMTPSDTESDIEIIDTIINSNNNSNNNNNNNNDDVICNDNYNFERYTLNGIGGKLLRKAGWDGNKANLYEKTGGPIQLSTKYRPFQKKKNGLGYANVNYGLHNNNNNRLGRIHNNTFQLRLQLPYPTIMPPSTRSNTINTAIILDDDDDNDDDDDDDDDDDVIFIEKNEIKKKNSKNNISYDKIINDLEIENEEITKKYILKQFGKGRNNKKRQLAITKMVISIIDSYSQCKIIVPVRGKKCNHLQPFDAKCFLLRPKKYQKCTQCNQHIKKTELIKNEYFQNIFNKIREQEIKQIEIMKDGTWKPYGYTINKIKTHNVIVDVTNNDIKNINNNINNNINKKTENVIVLTSDDEDNNNNNEKNGKNKKNKIMDVVDLVDSSEDELQPENDV